ncbi:1,3-beta-glucanase [Glaciihabitans sp. INWT7]|uniref:glycosyl hydrolase n=1 Tax=Glaciihabitans sp. INWT7 TaxID=2596912 RepID=UPI0016255C56|nr:glycosyl hydrolase [Glaciihabitans sp. INWT7]QNE47003.1 1,3-beta-glucanase [Glaciihabitans sp. INWT7]
MTRSTKTTLLRTTGLLAAGVIVSLVAACSGPGTTAGSPSTQVLSDSSVGSTIAKLPHKTVGEVPVSRLAHGLAPPTNRWFSGLVFGEHPLPVFPLPLSFGLTDSGFTFGLPEVTTTANTITGGNAPSVTIDAGASTSVITGYDDASVTIAHKTGSGSTVGSTVIAEGSPLVSFTAAKKLTLELGQKFSSSGKGVFSTKVGKTTYGMRTTGSVTKDGTALSLVDGATAVWFPVPSDGTLSEVAANALPVTGVTLDYSSGGSTASTTLAYATAKAENTLIATLPHQQKSMTTPACSLGSYPSIYGTMQLCAGKSLSWTSPTVAASDTIDLGSLDAAKKAQLTTALAQDVAGTAALPADTYFGGKALYRLANLLMLADQLGDTSSAKTVGAKLSDALREWTDPTRCKSNTERCFVYDPKTKGIVGLAASFGSDQFNDHNFHYGYFLYAASVAAAHDSKLRTEIAPVMNLLAADLASSGGSKYFPDRRGFDAYAGHSWASGYSPFADGNNLESSSEAVNAWNGLALWASVSDNSRLKTEASWMLASEAASARAYWTDVDTSDPVYANYTHSVVALNWGGKRDYSTWFSADANAKLGIQLIPMSPASGYLAADSKHIAQGVAEATSGDFNKQFGDYLLMYEALGGADQAKAALATAKDLPEKFIDDGNSRSYLLAWIMTRA